MPIYIYARAVFSWGYSVRPPGLSAGGPSLPLPPPSTLVGALAAGLARALGWSEYSLEPGRRGRVRVASTAWTLARHLLGAGARLVGGVAVFQDVVKYSTLPYQTPGNLADPAQWFGAQNFGLTIAPGSNVEFVLVFDDTLEEEGVDEGLLRAAAASMFRIGSKESLVSVEDYAVGRASQASGGSTSLYAPRDCVEFGYLEPGSYLEFEAWNPRCPQAYERVPPTELESLYLVAPQRVLGASTVLATGEEPLELRGNVTTYRGSWPDGLGVVAALPPCRAGGAER